MRISSLQAATEIAQPHTAMLPIPVNTMLRAAMIKAKLPPLNSVPQPLRRLNSKEQDVGLERILALTNPQIAPKQKIQEPSFINSNDLERMIPSDKPHKS